MDRVFIDTHSPRQCEAAVAEMLIFGPSASEFLYVGSVSISELDWTAAKAIGEARKCLKDRSGRRVGESRNFDVETEAALAELRFADFVEHCSAHIAPFVAHRPCPGLDAMVDGVSIDVKAVRLAARGTSINHGSHQHSTAALYVFARIADRTTIDFFAISHEAVSRWELKRPLVDGRPAPRKWYYAASLPPTLTNRKTA